MISKRVALHNQEDNIKLFKEHCTLAKDSLVKAKLFFIQNKFELSTHQVQLALKLYGAWTQPLLNLSIDTLFKRRLHTYLPILLDGCLNSAELHYTEAIKELVLDNKKEYFEIAESLYQKYCEVYPVNARDHIVTINEIQNTIQQIQAQLVAIQKSEALEEKRLTSMQTEQKQTSSSTSSQFLSSTASIYMTASMPPKSLLPVTILPIPTYYVEQELKRTLEMAEASSQPSLHPIKTDSTNYDERMETVENVIPTPQTVEFNLMELQQLFPISSPTYESLMTILPIDSVKDPSGTNDSSINLTFSSDEIGSPRHNSSRDCTSDDLKISPDLTFSTDEIDFLENLPSARLK